MLTTTSTAGVTTTYSYDQNGDTNGATSEAEQVTYRGDELAQAVISNTLRYTDTYLYDPSGAPLELIRQTKSGSSLTTARYWYVLNGHGDVVALTDVSGTVVDSYSYDLWGKLGSASETVPQRLRYAGYWYDQELGWYWVSVRSYNPTLMRWLQPDPSQQDGVRTYVYVGDDPVDTSDPTGLTRVAARFEPLSRQFPASLVPGSHAYILVSNGLKGVEFEATPNQKLPGPFGAFGNVYGTLIGHRKPSSGFLTRTDLKTEASQQLKTIEVAPHDKRSIGVLDREFSAIVNQLNGFHILYNVEGGLSTLYGLGPNGKVYGANSNSFAYTALTKVFSLRQISTDAPTFAPGWGDLLPCFDNPHSAACQAAQGNPPPLPIH